MKTINNAKLVTTSEILFVILPMLVISIVKLIDNEYANIFYATDWSFCSVVLFGQSVVKLASATSANKERIRWQAIGLIVSVIIVFGIVPSCVLLTKLMSNNKILNIFYWVQLLLFVTSCLVYFNIVTISNLLMEKQESS